MALQHRPIPQECHAKMKGSVRRALIPRNRQASWDVLGVAVFPLHQMDPETKAFVTHLSTLLRALREGSQSLLRTWIESKDWRLKAKPRGPRATFEYYKRRFRFWESSDGRKWSSEDNQIDILDTPWQKCLHYLRHLGRVRAISRAQQTRRHYEGLEQVDWKTSVRLTRKIGTVNRGLLIQIVCDSVWTQRLKYCAGLTEEPTCPWCGEEETLLHLWFECPQWEALRGVLRDHEQEIRGMGGCTSQCFLLKMGAPDKLRKAWTTVQQEAANLLRHRYKAQTVPQRIARKAEWEADAGVVGTVGQIPGRLIDFDYTERIYSTAPTWPFSRTAWREMCYWAGQVRIDQSGSEPPTILEAFLSYLDISGGQRMITNLPESQHGSWCSRQLSHFRAALNAFQQIAKGPPLNPAPNEEQYADWGILMGFPKLPRLASSVVLPGEVQEALERARYEIALLPIEGNLREQWRRWTPGIPGTQMEGEHVTWAKPLWQPTPEAYCQQDMVSSMVPSGC